MKLFFLVAAIAALAVPAESVSEEQEIQSRLAERSGAADAVFNKITAKLDEEEDDELLGDAEFNMTAGGRRRRRRKNGGGACDAIKTWYNQIDCNKVCSGSKRNRCNKWRDAAIDYREENKPDCSGDYKNWARETKTEQWPTWKNGACDDNPDGADNDRGASLADSMMAPMSVGQAMRGK